jgi:Glycosyl transferase family 2
VNKGLLHARGEVLAWINGDDEVIPAAIDEALAHLAANPECQVVYAGITSPTRSASAAANTGPRRGRFRRYLLLGDYVPTPAILFRRERLDAPCSLDEH